MRIRIGRHDYEIDRVEHGSYDEQGKIPAMRLWDDYGELISTPTVNLEAYGLFPPEGYAFIKDYAEGEGVAKELERLGIIRIEDEFTFGPYDTRAVLAELTHG